MVWIQTLYKPTLMARSCKHSARKITPVQHTKLNANSRACWRVYNTITVGVNSLLPGLVQGLFHKAIVMLINLAVYFCFFPKERLQIEIAVDGNIPLWYV